MLKPMQVAFMIKNKFTYKTVLITALSAFLCLTLNAIGYNTSFLSVALLIALNYLGLNPLVSGLAFIIGFIPFLDLMKILLAGITALINLPIFALIKKKKVVIGGKIIPISLLSIIPFVAFGNYSDIIYGVVQGVLCMVLTPVFILSSRVLFIKRFNYDCQNEELVCLAVFGILTSLGFISFFGFNLYRSVSVFIILFVAFVFGSGTQALTAGILAVAPSCITLSYEYFAYFCSLALCVAVFCKKSKFLTALSCIFCDLLFTAVFKIGGAFLYTDILYAVVPISVFLFLPNALFTSLRKKAENVNLKILPRYAINRMRLSISGKLYDVAGVFSEMKQGFEKLQNSATQDEELFGRMADEVMLNACENCPSFIRCNQKGLPDRMELIKIISVGVAKNRVSLIDLTKKFAENCGYVNSIIFEINELIGKYREKVKEISDLSSGKELITMQSGGVSEVLKNLAFDFSKTLATASDTEKSVSDALRKKGVRFSEVMALGEGDDLEISILLNSDDFSVDKIVDGVSQAVGKKMSIVSKTCFSINSLALSLTPAPLLDASFGLAGRKKSGSNSSGDTHSLTKLNEGSFLVALSDGMGSGTMASKTSSTAISLIESFYKAGLESNSVLSMVNKVLALNTDDNFSAIDILTVNLFDLGGDFIKIGSPASYIITNDSIRIVEGGSLPLGILDDIKPTGISVPLTEGCTVLMVTDGIFDAFGSSTDLITYLKSVKSLNPQNLADNLLEKALSLENNSPKDDMTVLCVRIFKKAS